MDSEAWNLDYKLEKFVKSAKQDHKSVGGTSASPVIDSTSTTTFQREFDDLRSVHDAKITVLTGWMDKLHHSNLSLQSQVEFNLSKSMQSN